MNTSMPTTPSDLAAIIPGGPAAKPTALLKGIFAALSNSKSVSADAGSSTGKDFASLLGSPASTLSSSDGNPADGQTSPEGSSQNVLSAELSFSGTTPLQIKGMCCRMEPLITPAADTTEPVSISLPLTPPNIDGSIPVVLVPEAVVVDPKGQVTSSVQNALKPVEGNSVKLSRAGLKLCHQKTENVADPATPLTPLSSASQEEKNSFLSEKQETSHFSRFGRGGWQPQGQLLSATRGMKATPTNPEVGVNDVSLPTPSISSAEVTQLSVVNPVTEPATVVPIIDSHPSQIFQALYPVVNDTKVEPVAISEEPIHSVTTVISSPVSENVVPSNVMVTDYAPAVVIPWPKLTSVDSASSSAVMPLVITAPDAWVAPVVSDTVMPSIVTDVAVAPVVIADGQSSVTPRLAPAHSLRTHALLHQPAGEFSVPTEDLLPAVEKSQSTSEIQPISAENSESVPLTPELRREVVEAVAALLAPLWLALPQIKPDALPNASSGSGIDALSSEGGKNALNTTITIKVGAQPPITIQLPPLASTPVELAPTTDVPPTAQPAAEVAVSDQTLAAFDRQSNPSGRSPIENTLLHQVVRQLTAQETPWRELPLLDFRLQLKTKIESAWAKQEPLIVPVTPELMPDLSEGRPLPVSVISGESDSTKPVTPPVVKEGSALRFATPLTVQPEQKHPTATATATTPVEVLIELPGFGSLTAEILNSTSPVIPLDKKPANRLGRTEKNAGEVKFVNLLSGQENNAAEKTFLNTAVESLKSKASGAGIDVANSSDNMPAQFTSRRVSVDQLEIPLRTNGREIFPVLNGTPNFSASTEASVEATPAPVLAHRAVETILNVVDAQRQSSANASSVNLHFKFGGDDLAVRVQMRGGEVQTQFLTDSAELRSALTSEWQIMAGQGGAAGLRLLDPVIMPASASVSSGFGNAAQGQNHAQQQAQQHQEKQAAVAFPELRELRRGNPDFAPKTESAPRVIVTPSTSQHLTALA